MECLTKHRAALAFKRGKNGLNVLICLFTGETAVICAQHKVERNALLPVGNAGAAVDVKQLDRAQQLAAGGTAQSTDDLDAIEQELEAAGADRIAPTVDDLKTMLEE